MICHNFYKYYNLLHNAGGENFDGSWRTVYNDVLEYDMEEQLWNTVGSMTMKRSRHAVSVINYNSIKDFCN